MTTQNNQNTQFQKLVAELQAIDMPITEEEWKRAQELDSPVKKVVPEPK